MTADSLVAALLRCHSSQKETMLRITTETKRSRIVLTVEGRIAGASVGTVEQCWRELFASSPKQKFIVNLCGVSFIDNAGKVLLREMHSAGAELQAEGCLNQAIVKEICASDEAAEKSRKPKGAPIIFYVALLSLTAILSPEVSHAQRQPAAPPASAPNGTVRLSLEQSVARALKQNPTEQIALLNAVETVQDKNIIHAQLLPQADLRASDSLNRVNLQSEFGGKPIFPDSAQLPGHIGPYQIFSVGPAFGTPVVDMSLWKHDQASRENVNALGVELAKEEVGQARDRFQAGVANNIELISAQDSLSRANDNQIAALYRFNQARADYARAIGEMEKTYSK
jgi:anti-anti-sigma regulatory factor